MNYVKRNCESIVLNNFHREFIGKDGELVIPTVAIRKYQLRNASLCEK